MTSPRGTAQQAPLFEHNGVPATIKFTSSPSGQLITGAGLIIAITFGNFAATTAGRFYLLDGTDNTGQPIAVCAAQAGGGGSITPPPPYIPYKNGLYCFTNAGVLQATLTYLPLYNLG